MLKIKNLFVPPTLIVSQLLLVAIESLHTVNKAYNHPLR